VVIGEQVILPMKVMLDRHAVAIHLLVERLRSALLARSKAGTEVAAEHIVNGIQYCGLEAPGDCGSAAT
jgi:hypothetical protein